MKTSKLLLVSASILAALMLGVVFLQVPAQSALTINVAWNPKSYMWSDLPPNPFNAELWRQKVQTTLDPSTILLEGLYSPSAPAYNATHGPRLVVPFNGADVKAALYAKLPTHMGMLIPGTYKIQLVITGQLYTGETVQGDGPITVTVPSPPPP